MKNNDIKNRIDALEEHLRDSAECITSDSVTENSFYSYRHANRLFTASKGESINSFVNKIRHQKAAEYLLYSGQSILEIAFNVGYETTASFSKAFKKSYQSSPSAYRKKYKELSLDLPTTSQPRAYTIRRFDPSNLLVKKITFKVDISEVAFLKHTQTILEQWKASERAFMYLWDEDPYQCLFPETRVFLCMEGLSSLPGDGLPNTQGRYAFFDTSLFGDINCEEWHRLAYLILELDQIKIQDRAFIEYFPAGAIKNLASFYPTQIAIPIQ
ncbi:MAG: AraC family transcriptional regulator [Bacteroidota bacterium]